MSRSLSSFPPEILDCILEYLTPPYADPADELWSRQRPSTGGVKNDRILALECASLISPGFRTMAQARLVRSKYVTSGKSADYALGLGSVEEAAAGAVLAPLVRDLTIKVDFWGPRQSGYGEHHIPALASRMPNLRSLRFERMVIEHATTVLTAVDRLERLVSLDLADLEVRSYTKYTSRDLVPTPWVHHLTVMNPNTGDIDLRLLAALFPSFTHLESITLYPLPGFIFLQASTNVPAHLLHLKTLSLTGERLESLLDILDALLSPETLQILPTLSLAFNDKLPLRRNKTFEAVGPSLRHLHWHGPTRNLEACVRQCPKLESLGPGHFALGGADENIWTFCPATLREVSFDTCAAALPHLKHYEQTPSRAATLLRVRVFRKANNRNGMMLRKKEHDAVVSTSAEVELLALCERLTPPIAIKCTSFRVEQEERVTDPVTQMKTRSEWI